VAWIAERKDVLCGFFFLLAILFYAKHFHAKKTAGGAGRFYWLSLLAFALALLSKPMAVTLPFVLLLLDVWPLEKISGAELKKFAIWQKPVLEKIPFFALTAIFCVLTFMLQRGESATASLQEISLTLRLENVVASYWRYLGWSLWPANLTAFYSFPYDQHFYLALWPGWVTVLAAGALAAISVFCFFQMSRRPYLAVGWFWYLGMMVPVIGLVQVGSQGMADRYTYLPLIGPAIAVVWFFVERCGARVVARWACGIFLGIGLCAAFAQTRHQLSFWQNTETLCLRTIQVTGENPHAEYILGLGLEQEDRIPEAMKHYANAIASQPRIREAFYALGRLFGQQGRWTESALAFTTALGDNPNDFTAHLGLATTLPHLSRLAEAKTHLQAAIQLCPNAADALNNLAWALATSDEAELRDGERAVTLAQRACELTGHQETIMVGTLGAAYAEAGKFDDAIAAAQSACELAAKSHSEPLITINNKLLQLYQQRQPYREIFEAGATTNAPPEQKTLYALGRQFAEQGKWSQAAQTYATALGDNPNDFAAHLGLDDAAASRPARRSENKFAGRHPALPEHSGGAERSGVDTRHEPRGGTARRRTRRGVRAARLRTHRASGDNHGRHAGGGVCGGRKI
jgi:tetratricopeptide (TPR) repeat protein